ncbi:site-specific DNA-methyltransferase [uncultured Proteiniphilum sp.]|uniref:DNA methyltransferase n=1 Tax=uncultured Proteiniphilum sp. TaxID=497637 RepID=UPI00262F37A2|nr:site-specific DNA-methyltransferase [uncultured Proteiniphilum sp.]
MAKLPLTEKEIEFIIEQLQNGQQLPEDLEYKLFPTKQKEYELVYGGKMRKEDILANEDGVFPIPLQIEKIFNDDRKTWEDGWRNMIVFGDNLQFLKTIYENKDPLIKDKIKGKVKLIYIDPPFATESDFKSGDKIAYTDKVKGAEFVEFLRRRLTISREILAPEGSIYVHLDWKMTHYVKIIMDEIFGKENFLNEIIWYYRRWNITTNLFARNHDTLLMYAKKRGDHIFNNLYIPKSEKSSGQGRAWQSVIDEETGVRRSILLDEKSKGVPMPDVWDISMINPVALERKNVNYPTQKPEDLIERIVKASTNEGDIILDFFSGSGTTVAVAEKLNRKWIACDIGKLSFYTTQKRLINIQNSKDLNSSNKNYSKPAKTFVTLNTGQYNLEKVFGLKQEEYKKFVMELFEIDIVKNKKINGIPIDGQKKDGFYVIIYPYWEFKDATVDEDYLEDLHSHIGKNVGGRLYIIAPANSVDFISDYHIIENVRYYFLKVPYQIIKELHKVEFKKFRQPQSKSNVNDLEDAVGFHFMRQPIVISEIKNNKNKLSIQIKEFYSDFTEEETGKDMDNFESLAMVLIDKNYNGEAFEMDEYYFAEDLLPKTKKKKEEDENNLKEELKKQKIINIELNKKGCGNNLMAIYIDIYGNEFKEVLSLK